MADTPMPSWARKHLAERLADTTIVNHEVVGGRRVLANTSLGSILLTKPFFGGARHVVLEVPSQRTSFSCPSCDERLHFLNLELPADVYCSICAGKFAIAADGTVQTSEGKPVVAEHRPAATPARVEVPVAEVAAPADAKEPGARRNGKSDKSEKAADGDYKPQCSALTSDGSQCRNSARGTSKYCSSHKGYQPPGAKQVAALLDTAPAAEGTEDRLASVRGRPAELADTTQCAAITADGAQCRNPCRGSSKYCRSHKGYQPPTAQAIANTRDTEPRVAGAKDTKPSVRKARSK